jgi:hypothetical protein
MINASSLTAQAVVLYCSGDVKAAERRHELTSVTLATLMDHKKWHAFYLKQKFFQLEPK